MGKCMGFVGVVFWFVTGLLLNSSAQILIPNFINYNSQAGIVTNTKTKYFGSCVADIDGDGRYDLLLSNHKGNLDLYWSDRTQRYVKSEEVKLPGRDFHSFAIGDLTGDGTNDIILTAGGGRGTNPSKPYYIAVDGKEDVEITRGIQFGMDVGMRGRSLRFIDINLDGKADIIFVNERKVGETVSHLVFENLGDGNFAQRTVGFEAVKAKWLTVVDVNKDGKLDILFLLYASVQLWMGTGDFNFVDETATRLPNGGDLKYVRGAAELDYDGDEDFDLYLAVGLPTFANRVVNDKMWENRNGVYVDVSAQALVPTGGHHMHVTAGDFNNDGTMDVFVSVANAEESPRNDFFLFNNGSKKFQIRESHGAAPRIPAADGNSGNAFDFNNDGRLDLLVGLQNGPWILFKNTTPKTTIGNWLLVRIGLFTKNRPITPLGAWVKVVCGGKRFVQRVGSAGESHSPSFLNNVHFGLGTCPEVTRIIVKYPGNVITGRGMPQAVNQQINIGYFPTKD